MRKYDTLKGKKDAVISEVKSELDKMQLIGNESKRVSEVAGHAGIIINDLDRQFEQATKLDGIDITFLFFATALQCVRQYIIGTITQRSDDKTAADKTKGHEEEHSDRSHKLYSPTLDEIMTNPVPFDTNYGGKEFDLGIGGGFTHRAKTLGHDPILGWIFGTMNIATSTMTVSEGLQSYHILTGYTTRGDARDKISKHADTWKVLKYSKNKFINEGETGKEKIGLSLFKEAVHLKSDLYSTASLPLPVISIISVDAARKLANYGFDMGNAIKIVSQAEFANLINSLVAMIHGLFYDQSRYSNWNMYSVKTRKILSYSNVIASASNVIAVAVAAGIGAANKDPKLVKKVVNYLDIGGIMVTIYRIVNDHKFIKEVKQEFLEHEFYNIVMGD